MEIKITVPDVYVHSLIDDFLIYEPVGTYHVQIGYDSDTSVLAPLLASLISNSLTASLQTASERFICMQHFSMTIRQ